jgi:hypothetical protein
VAPGEQVNVYGQGSIANAGPNIGQLSNNSASDMINSNAQILGYLGGTNAQQAGYLFNTNYSSSINAVGATTWSKK